MKARKDHEQWESQVPPGLQQCCGFMSNVVRPGEGSFGEQSEGDPGDR